MTLVSFLQSGAVDAGDSLNMLLVVLGAFGLNIATIVGGVVALTSRLTRIEAAQAAAKEMSLTTSAHLREVNAAAIASLEKDVGRMDQRLTIAERDIDKLGNLCRDVKNAADTLLELRGKP